MNGIMEAHAVPLKCDFCVEDDYAKLLRCGFRGLGLRPTEPAFPNASFCYSNRHASWSFDLYKNTAHFIEP